MSRKKSRPSVSHSPSMNHDHSQAERRPPSGRTVSRINRKLVLFTGVAVVLCGAGVHGLHAVMVDRNAGDVLERAEEAERKGDTKDAARLLSQYLQFRPDDLDVVERFALLIHQPDNPSRTARRVYTALEEVLRKDPTRTKLRKPLSEAAMSLRRFADAEFHLEELLKTQKDDAELVRLKARARASTSGTSTRREAAELYLASIGLDPRSVDSYAELAALLEFDAESLPYWDSAGQRFLEQGVDVESEVAAAGSRSNANEGGEAARWASRADSAILGLFPAVKGKTTATDAATGVLVRMVAAAEPSWKAFEARAMHRQGRNDVAGAAEDVRRALESPEAKRDADVLLLAATIELALAEQAQRKGDAESAADHRDDARRLARAGQEAGTSDPRFHGLLADAELASGLTPETLNAAEKHLREGLAQIESQREDANAADAARLDDGAIQLRLSLASLLIARGEHDPARSTATEKAVAKAVDEEVQRLRKGGCRPQLIELVEIRVLAHQRDWDKAAVRLESLRPQVPDARDTVRQIDLMLGACYAHLQNPDRRIEVFSRAKADDPAWSQGRAALAEALAEAGRIDEALAEYGDAGGTPGVPREVARLALRHELRKPAADRNFDAAEAAVAAAEKAAPGDPVVVALRIELFVARKNFAAADKLATRLAQESPESTTAWRTWFNLALVRGDQSDEQRFAAARDRLAEGERRFGNVVETRLAKADLVRLENPEELRSAVTALANDVEKLSSVERARLYDGLILGAARAGEKETVLALWKKVVAERPDDLTGWLAVAQGAAEAGDEQAVAEAMEAVRRIEGPNGPNGDFVAAIRLISRMIKDPRSPDDPARKQDLETARRLLSRAAQRRSVWSAVPRALGILETLDRNPTAAFEQFRRARDLGDSSLEVIRGLVAHHGSENRWDLAAAVLDEAERDSPGLFRSGEMARLKGVVALKQGDVDAAIAAMGVAGDSGGIDDRITHADLLYMKYQRLTPEERESAAGKKSLDDVTASFRRLVDDMPQEPRAWLACIVHLVRINRGGEARSTLAEAETKLPIEPAAARLKSLALCYRAVQEPARAAEQMKKAVEAAPDDAALRLDAANFFAITGDLAEANRQLEWLLDADRDAPTEIRARARRLKAIATAATGRYEDLIRAVASLGPVAGGGEVPIGDLRAQVALLARRRSLKDRRELIKLLEEIRDRAALSPEQMFSANEKFALAALYQQTSQWAKAKPIIEELLQEQGVDANYTTALIMGGLRDRSPSLSDAELESELLTSIERLKALEPGTMRVALTVAEFEHRFDRPASASQALSEYVATLTTADSRGGADVTAEELAEIRAIASRAEELKLDRVAEECFRRVAENSTNPNDGLAQAMYLGRRGRYDEALRLVEGRPAGASSEAAALTAVSIVSMGRPTTEHMNRAEAIVDETLRAAPSSTRTIGLLAGLRMAQGRYDESEAMYQRILAENPGDVSVLNNLAWLLVVTGKDPKAAAKLIDEAIAIAGPLADLIDTRGVILLALRRPDEAVNVLRDEFENGPTPNPALGFHLATAYLALDRLEDARKTFARAQKLGLGIERLHLTEHKAYGELVRRIGGDIGRD
ncbi:MAG: tetratricopeptide repeat protein [Planctomycetaceae bacterium]